LVEHYTRAEVARILGIGERRLSYWERIRLIEPHRRWGQRFYSFRDLVALKTIQQLTDRRVPARRLRRAIQALQRQLGEAEMPLSALRVVSNGREVAVIAPESQQPFEPLTGQFVLNFDTQALAGEVRRMASRSAEEWFELGLKHDSDPESWPQAVEAYRRAVELAPKWLEAQINLGATLYQLGRMEEAERVFRAAVEIDPDNATVQFNLGCVLDELGQVTQAIIHLKHAVQIAPGYADAHFNLALACEKRGDRRSAGSHWAEYLRLEPNGAWADYARARLIANSPHPRKQ
jgi:tetratricopeptide (TPR) repeat protein